MRRNIVHMGAGSLTYAIREIVEVAHRFRDMGQEIVWENIGDPIQKGEKIAPWIREVLHEIIDDDASWGYCDTAGVRETREWIAAEVNKQGGAQIGISDIIFFNGIGDAVAKVYGFLRREARVIGPTPAYSTHSSAEAAHSGYEHLTYDLDPYNGWLPDLDDLRNKVHYNDSIAGILLINPDNPTGAVYPREVIEEIVQIARKYKLFLLCDEIYTHIVYGSTTKVHMATLAEDVPTILMRGVSKEYPWPGARCGWIEVLNRETSPIFSQYVNSLLASKRLEVCSTTAPQLSIPRVMGDARYPAHLAARAEMFRQRAREATEAFAGIPGVIANEPQGAFYMTVLFEPGILNAHQTLEIPDDRRRRMVEQLVASGRNDQRFVYYLMGSTGICVVPLTGFCCNREGFRFTLLETDDAKRAWTYRALADAIQQYVHSCPQPAAAK